MALLSKSNWRPWHEVYKLRDDVKSGKLSMSTFAADLYDVYMRPETSIYGDPANFFSLTYPTYNLRELVKEVLLRLAGQSDKAVRQLELTYGGGKTHALITLYHLVRNPSGLPDLPAIREFQEHAGVALPKACVAVLAFDKLDVEKGMEVVAPDGTRRWLRQPWSVLAWQIAESEGLRLLHPEGRDEERESAPAQNLLEELLSLPGREGAQPCLLLLDEVLMYAYEKIALHGVWRQRLQNFFQYLTQAVTKMDRVAMVVSLLASDPRKSDEKGREIAKDFYDIFRREREEGVQPVEKEDVAELLRRHFFQHDPTLDEAARRPHVLAALRGIGDLDEDVKKGGHASEARFLDSYPFHPDLTEVFYSKWTNLDGFQRARGILHTFALALRDAQKWDTCPLIAENVLLAAPSGATARGRGKAASPSLSEAARELANVAAIEEYEGRRQDWNAILVGELEKARIVQQERTGLHHREIERAVMATFLHSQPIGQKASTRDLFVLLGQTHPDRIELEKGLRQWGCPGSSMNRPLATWRTPPLALGFRASGDLVPSQTSGRCITTPCRRFRTRSSRHASLRPSVASAVSPRGSPRRVLGPIHCRRLLRTWTTTASSALSSWVRARNAARGNPVARRSDSSTRRQGPTVRVSTGTRFSSSYRSA